MTSSSTAADASRTVGGMQRSVVRITARHAGVTACWPAGHQQSGGWQTMADYGCRHDGSITHLDAHGLHVHGILHLPDAPSCSQQSLGGHTATVDTCPANVMPLDDGNLHALQ